MIRRLSLILCMGLLSSTAQAFCVVNDSDRPVTVQAGGPPMPVYVKPNLQPGQRDCHTPRRPEGIMVQIIDSTSGQPRCRNSVPAKNATLFAGQNCRVQVD